MKFFGSLIFSIPLFFSASVVVAEVMPWKYAGVKNQGTLAEAITAETRVNDDILQLMYFPADGAFTLWFSYKGDVSFSQGMASEAEFFLRTNETLPMNGRYDSDYVFTGMTIAQPDKNPRAPQFVVVDLSVDDVMAIQRYEGNGVIGVGYFIEGDLWRTYSLPSQGIWAAFERVWAVSQ